MYGVPGPQPPQWGAGRRVGYVVLKALAERALELIPFPFGIFFSLGVELQDTIRRELINQYQYALTPEQMLESLHALTRAEAEQIVDATFMSPRGIQELARLTDEQRGYLRQRLVGVRSKFDLMISDAEAQQLRNLHEHLETQLGKFGAMGLYETYSDYGSSSYSKYDAILILRDAHGAAEEILRIRPKDRDALRMEAYLHKQLTSTRNPVQVLETDPYMLWGSILGMLLMLITSLVLSITRSSLLHLLSAIVEIPILALFWVIYLRQLWPLLPRSFRKNHVLRSIVTVGTTILIYVAIALLLGAPFSTAQAHG